MPLDSLTDAAIDQLNHLNLQSEEEEIEVIYVENLNPAEIVEFARYGELQIMEELVKLGFLEKLRAATDSRGNTALHMAAANGHYEVVKYILSELASDTNYINVLNHEKNTALHWASLNGHEQIVNLLLTSGADHLIKNTADRLAFDEALQQNHESIMTLIADHTDRMETSRSNDNDEELN